MDIFKFNNPESPTKMEQGEIINGLTSKMWIERYDKSGEFSLVAPANIGMRETLPIGTFISHINTPEIMIVENHEISDDIGQESNITITGRGFETFFENRIVGSNRTFPRSEEPVDYVLAADSTWNQAVQLIQDHTLDTLLLDDRYAIPYMAAMSIVDGDLGAVERSFKRTTLYENLLELLSIDGLGIRVMRPGVWSPFGANDPTTAIVIHVGNDRTQQISFSYDTGDIVSADYLWSNKNKKNAALVYGKWVETIVDPGDEETQYNRRMISVDASDIDQDWDAPPTGTDLDVILGAMRQMGREVLASMNDVVLTKAEVSKDTVKAVYRSDFDVGDLITVNGDYNEVAVMRVIEYVEIEDSTGESGYPTLSLY